MLDNEPDNNSDTNNPTDGSGTPAPATRPRRRRAASRPAGPPASAPDAPAIERVEPVADEPISQPVALSPDAPAAPSLLGDAPEEVVSPEIPVEAAVPAKKTARKAAAKRPAKKTAASAGEAADAGEAGDLEPPKVRAPRKRAAKKTAAPAPAAEDSADDLLALAELIAAGPSARSDEPTTQLSWPETVTSDDDAAAVPSNANLSSDDVPTVEVLTDDGSSEHGSSEHVSSEDLSTEVAPAEIGPDPTFDAPAEPDQGVQHGAVGSEPEPTEADTPTVETESSEDGPTDDAQTDEVSTDEAEDAVTDDAEPEDPEVAEDTDVVEDTDAADDDTDGEGDGNRRRRRRRGGRRRRRTGGDDDSAESDPSAEGAEDAEAASPDAETESDSSDEASEADGDGDSENQRRRRRRRRRRGEEAGSSPDDPTEVVVRVREPRRSQKVNTEVTGIEGSTRMEAKRQRRRDGREAGRRRPPILSEAEFLARREAVSRKMIIRQREDLAQIAVLEDDILVEHYVDRDSAASLIGNVYLGRVQNVLPSMEAAFIDIGRGRNAVLYAGEVDWDSFGAEGQNRKVEKVLKSGQTILVQVSKDPIGSKGARLTNHVSIPGRYIVYAPGGHLSGISRKLPDIERKRLRDILAELVGESASVIVRTAAEGASEEELVRDVNRLKAQWEDIERKVASGSAPQLLYGEPDLTVRIVRDLFTEDFSELIIAGNGGMNDAYDAVEAYVTHVAPHLQDRLRKWEPGEDGRDIFAEYRLDEQIAKALERKVFLPSGGSLIIDRTEAMTVIDVNTGKFTGTGGNLEATVTSNNLEAAEEIVRQLRLRDIGGIIVIDFIDMVLPSNRELLLRRVVECLGRDRTRHQVAEITSLGLVQMTRKKIGTGLLEAFTSECPHCNGRGVELHDVPVESQKQADGGTREPRPRDQRRGGGSSSPKPSEPAKSQEKSQDSKSRDDRSSAGESPDSPADGPDDDNGGGEERPTRNRRGGRNRRAATREQGAPSTPPVEPALVS